MTSRAKILFSNQNCTIFKNKSRITPFFDKQITKINFPIGKINTSFFHLNLQLPAQTLPHRAVLIGPTQTYVLLSWAHPPFGGGSKNLDRPWGREQCHVRPPGHVLPKQPSPRAMLNPPPGPPPSHAQPSLKPCSTLPTRRPHYASKGEQAFCCCLLPLLITFAYCHCLLSLPTAVAYCHCLLPLRVTP